MRAGGAAAILRNCKIKCKCCFTLISLSASLQPASPGGGSRWRSCASAPQSKGPRFSVWKTGAQHFIPLRSLSHAVQNVGRAVGIAVYVGAARAAGEDEDGGKAGFHARDDVGVHPVADHGGLFGSGHPADAGPCAS